MSILTPLFVQVGLTFVLLAAMGRARVGAIKSKDVRIRDVALRQQNWSEKTTKISNAFHNQIETPMLFYVLVILLIITNKADSLQLFLAWAYVATRIVHALIHVTSNNVSQRFYAFLVSVVILGLMWVKFFLKVTF